MKAGTAQRDAVSESAGRGRGGDARMALRLEGPRPPLWGARVSERLP